MKYKFALGMMISIVREYDAIDKGLFIRKPIENEELLKEIKRIMNST
jgi:hypothetical protein